MVTERQWYRMVDNHMGKPVALNRADLTRPFVYERGWGVSYVPCGYHGAAMGLLLAFAHDQLYVQDIFEIIGVVNEQQASDHWMCHALEATFRSSVGQGIEIGDLDGLTVSEKRFLMT